jgi:phage/plasmid-like protein (TIGR03299 family)
MKTTFEKTFDLLNATGLNWTVNKEELVSRDGKSTESFGIFKNGTGQWLGTVGNQYQPFQNSDLAETIIVATEGAGLQTTRGGQLCDNRKVYLQAELPSQFIGNSNVLRWITALSSHDGSSSIGFGSSNTVVVCQNTFYKAYSGLQKFRHTDSAKERVKQAAQELRAALGLDQQLMESFKHMADIKLKDEIFAKVMKACFDVTPDQKQDDLSTRKINQLKAVSTSIETEIKLEGATLWGLFNGITRYTNHVAAKPDNKIDYLMTGGGYRTNLVAFDTIMKWISENTETPMPVLN